MAEAQRLILEAVEALPPETVPTREAQGRILAETIRATRTLPPTDVSAMDGYAVSAQALADASTHKPVRLRVAFEVPAGASGRALESGEVARILTGAGVPPGADAVVRQEDVEREGDWALFTRPARKGEDIRPAGEDVRSGEPVLEPGTPLGPGPLGLLAALGRSVVAVPQRPRVAILSGGDELVEPDEPTPAGRIVASNSYSLAAQCREAGAEPVYLGIARDRPEDLEARLRAGLRCHAIVSSAGVSVGDHDYVRPVLERLGCELRFFGVQMKPGYPMTFGRFRDGALVFGLPGNPVSAMVTFEQFVRPALRKMTGWRTWFRPRLRARLTHELTKKPGRLHFVRVRLAREDGDWWATSTGNQSSGVLRSMALAHGLLLFPARSERLAEGEAAEVQLLDPEVLSETESGL